MAPFRVGCEGGIGWKGDDREREGGGCSVDGGRVGRRRGMRLMTMVAPSAVAGSMRGVAARVYEGAWEIWWGVQATPTTTLEENNERKKVTWSRWRNREVKVGSVVECDARMVRVAKG